MLDVALVLRCGGCVTGKYKSFRMVIRIIITELDLYVSVESESVRREGITIVCLLFL